ncbi:hypothetical protein [Caballeronia sp. BR00000012568055]|uniref:hypothetical protein n=1 Tax=Caballeronia sp. BR00000012568055 TaxID=2918761 RepID=UPI0023F723CD|nr:hypothetical protein [Caballeronia sp. BR00000012568055]
MTTNNTNPVISFGLVATIAVKRLMKTICRATKREGRLKLAYACKPAQVRYTAFMVQTATTGPEKPECSKADDRYEAVFFRLYIIVRDLQWLGGSGWHACVRRFPWTPVFSASAIRPATRLRNGFRASFKVQGGRIMRRVLARPEQTESPLQIINRALRAAAVAPTVFDALDVTGDALRLLAELARGEVSHA